MIRMPIVSSEQHAGGALASFAKSRLIVFAAGVFVAVVLLWMAGSVSFPTGGQTPSGPPREWTVEINLHEDERYTLERNRSLSVRVWGDTMTEEAASNSSLAVRYGVTKFCGTALWSYVRFAVEGFRADEKLGSPSQANETAGEVQQAERYGNYLEESLQGHTFTANLTHDGCVAYRDETNVEATIGHVLKSFERGEDKTYLRDATLRAHLVQVGVNAVYDLQESAFNYLLASPPNVSVGEADAWNRTVSDGGEPVTVRYGIDRVWREEQDGAQPVFSGAAPETVAARAALYEEGRDRAWLVVRTGHTVAVSNTSEYVTRLVHYSGLLNVLNADIESVSMESSLNGTLVVGARTGLVADALLQTETTLRVNLRPKGTEGAPARRPPAASAADHPHPVVRALARAGAQLDPDKGLVEFVVRITERETANGWVQPLAREFGCNLNPNGTMV